MMHDPLTSAAVHFCWLTAHLYGEQISTGEIKVAQGCCELVLQSSTKQQTGFSALTSAAVHWACITAHLYDQQMSKGVIAVA